jgi:hypothetical protein
LFDGRADEVQEALISIKSGRYFGHYNVLGAGFSGRRLFESKYAYDFVIGRAVTVLDLVKAEEGVCHVFGAMKSIRKILPICLPLYPPAEVNGMGLSRRREKGRI